MQAGRIEIKPTGFFESSELNRLDGGSLLRQRGSGLWRSILVIATIEAKSANPSRWTSRVLMPPSTRTPCMAWFRINRLSRSDAILWPGIENLARRVGGSPIRVLDVASGGGDVPIALAKRALRSGLNVQVEGCDVSLEAVQYARRQAELSGLSLRFFNLDLLNEPIPPGYDVVTCSLFLHHLAEADASIFLRKAAGATNRLLLVNDLLRGPVGYLMAWFACRLLTLSPVVRYDGPVSVAGAFTLSEVRELAKSAGLEGEPGRRCWPRADFSCHGAVDGGPGADPAALDAARLTIWDGIDRS